MAQRTADEIRQAVSAAYGARAKDVAAGDTSGCCGDDCCGEARAGGVKAQYYSETQTDGLPETAVSYGCGNPVAIGSLQAGETVLDLGSGAGLDCFLAARQVGPAGRVIGLDMTDEMLALAAQNQAKIAAENVEFRKGVMEAMPVESASVDVIISNCVINLSPDKDAVFREAFRVLRPGGRLHVSDVVLLHPLSAAEQEDMSLWAGCIAGALERTDYAVRLHAAGFTDVVVTLKDGEDAQPWRSALIDAWKPGGSGRPRPVARLEPIEPIAVPGLQTGACCTTDADGNTRCC
ncbi:MAG TPA: arsenite methyltransferase [Dehalococcoidia bacterium]|nr:arsenite methyltransferase [Dehalococcoidia bacterium]